MVYRVVRETRVTLDLDIIEDYLVLSYQNFGEGVESATSRATARIKDALSYMRSLAAHPHRGTEHPEIQPGLRTLTNNRFIYYFKIDELFSEVRILAIFFGGMDHQRRMLHRLNSGQS